MVESLSVPVLCVCLRATLPKILIFNFHPEIDFAHYSSINFTWQIGNKYEIITEKLNFFKIF